ncbi:hypothetical protein LI99_07750 [Mycolicibacterium smegmatis]|uniref:Uncharacterized protein n=1 Tax=Mycolicibacterium smegmatis (strain ATCC 700084 / mc(2)155) TaxID=246196 RepID=A0QSP4_MYCS2|nr:hypothetical protein MSMEG_1551 [Mycolicibacterium smegmatis MC2 155]AIU13411.1 hypothetical protein LI99_07750 [Mycolicibacterium smegmatis]AIU06786.1 hypothetical protein LJ00_07750 [Mycolicibacterium smegmatis MC2 155]AIU20035.1 hypothetical protein LI98_07750 [Mycolicibacterium smegmatis]TBH44626.1 hypothetical protein EYS45_15655 [Mycolicibacterium smegmatis MC2 155]
MFFHTRHVKLPCLQCHWIRVGFDERQLLTVGATDRCNHLSAPGSRASSVGRATLHGPKGWKLNL